MNSKKLLFLSLMSLGLLIGCASTSDKNLVFKGYDIPPAPPPPNEEEQSLVELQNRLEMGRAIDQLGFEEKAFNGKYFSVIHFRAQCRATEGTVDHMSESELKPLQAGNIIWMIGKDKGKMNTDSAGYGQIRYLASTGSRNKRLILKSGEDILLLRLQDVSRFILPNYWCNP